MWGASPRRTRPQGTSAALLLSGAEAKLAEMLGDYARGPSDSSGREGGAPGGG